MQKSIQFGGRLLLFSAAVMFTAMEIATAKDAGTQLATVVTHAGEEIPTGFTVERYTRVWEHNPFTFVAPPAPQAAHSAFEKFFLTSWLKDGHTDVVFIQNLETNEVQKITAEPNQDSLRLIALHLNPRPQLVAALISDGKEQGLVKFRLVPQSPAGQTASPGPQMTNAGVTAPGSNSTQAVSATLMLPRTKLPNTPTSALPATAPGGQPLARPVGSGNPRAQMEGGQRPAPRGASEGVPLPRPARTSP
jgi:hypothetical protein